MNKKIKTIDYEWLTKSTGDPFADTGGFVIQYLWERFPEKDIDELIEYVTKIYVNGWDGKLHTFFNNSKITNPAFKTSEIKITGTIELFNSLIEEKEEHIQGNCRITGRQTKLFSAGREALILSGSGAFINFHHFFQQGLFLSKEVLIRMFFIPLGTQLLSGKIAVVQSSNIEFSQFYVYENCSANLRNISNLQPEILRSEFNKPSNALFDFINKLINQKNEIVEKEVSASLTLFQASNFKDKTEMKISHLPSTVFLFYIICNKLNYKKDWQRFLNSYYYNSKNSEAIYNIENEKFELTKKNKFEYFDYNDYKLWTNTILTNLLEGKSIIPEFLKWSEKGNKIHFDIIKIYLLNITKMKKETIQKITELADFIINDKSEDEIKKAMNILNQSEKPNELRRFFLDLVKENYEKENKKPLITIKDYNEYLFSDSSNSREIRDVLLIAIYQKLHEIYLKSE
jgi:CRISPR-associated protein Cst1